MSNLSVKKVVSSLPSTLVGDTIYLVRVGTGYDQYVTNSTGTIIAYALNSSSSGGSGSTFTPSRTYTNTTTSGVNYSEYIGVTVAPTDSSTSVTIASKVEMTVNTTNNITIGGYAVATQSVMNIGGTGTKDKIVVDMNQVAVTGGAINSLLHYEAVISSIDSGTTINGLVGYYVPNLSVVANIGNVLQYYAFKCDYTEAILHHQGVYWNGSQTELVAPNHPGLVAGRYYTPPYMSLQATSLATGIVYFSPVFIPHRTTITKLGFTVTTAAAAGTMARLALYRMIAGNFYLVLDAGEIATSTTGDKEITISQRVDGGQYAIAVQFSASTATNIEYNASYIGYDWRVGQLGQASSTAASATLATAQRAPYTYAAYPSAVAGTSITLATGGIVHLWYRVGV